MLAGIAEWAIQGKQQAAAVLDSMQQSGTEEPKQTWKEYAGRTTGPEGYSMGDITRHMAKKTKESVVDSIKHKVLRVIEQTYVDRVKPQLTADDKAMPMFVRRALHELADEFWAALNSELPTLIDRALVVAERERAEQSLANEAAPMLGDLLRPGDMVPSPPSPPASPPEEAANRPTGPRLTPLEPAAPGGAGDGTTAVVLSLSLQCELQPATQHATQHATAAAPQPRALQPRAAAARASHPDPLVSLGTQVRVARVARGDIAERPRRGVRRAGLGHLDLPLARSRREPPRRGHGDGRSPA